MRTNALRAESSEECAELTTIADSCSLPQRIERIKRAMTAAEVAKLLCVSPVTVYRMASAGQLPNFKVGTAVRFDPRAVADWLRGNIP